MEMLIVIGTYTGSTFGEKNREILPLKKLEKPNTTTKDTETLCERLPASLWSMQ